MGSKVNPGKFDCYDAALPDEPMFVLLGRDPTFGILVREWANQRERDIECGDRPPGDRLMVKEARDLAQEGEAWRAANNGAWRGVTRDADGALHDAFIRMKARHWGCSFSAAMSALRTRLQDKPDQR
jgi:hypothetical protein